MDEMDLPVQTRDAMGLNAVADELKKARSKHAPMHSLHEAYAVILEEMDELWAEVKKKREERDYQNVAKEMVQIAAMSIRALSDTFLIEKLESSDRFNEQSDR